MRLPPLLARLPLVLALPGGIFLMVLKYQVAALEQESRRLTRETARTREVIHLLHAERTHASDPARLARMRDRHLKSWGPVPHDRILTIDQLPWRGTEGRGTP
jgi:hypothetical protein